MTKSWPFMINISWLGTSNEFTRHSSSIAVRITSLLARNVLKNVTYRQNSNISLTLVGDKTPIFLLYSGFDGNSGTMYGYVVRWIKSCFRWSWVVKKKFTNDAKISILLPCVACRLFLKIFLKENMWYSITISMMFIPKGLMNNISALFQIMAWWRPGE